jgi:hypothetical protein
MGKPIVAFDAAKHDLEEFMAAKEAADGLSKMYGVRIGALETHTSAGDRLTWRLNQAEAMLAVVTGEGSETFHNYVGIVKDHYLCAVRELISAAHADATAEHNLRRARK